MLASLAGVALVLWATGVGQSGLNPIPVGPRPDPSYWSAARVCQRVFTNARDQRRCVQLAIDPSSSTLRAGAVPSFRTAARNGMYELIGWTPGRGGASGTWNTNPNNVISWNYNSGLWAGPELSHWWQSALALRTVVRYLERTHTTGRIYQQVLERTYRLEVHHPLAIASDYFVNMYGDDTAWWGIAWLEAANYEFNYVHNTADAATFLRMAEHDARYLVHMPRSCGGLVWELGYPTNTVTNAEYIALMAQLYSFRSLPGPFHNPSRARTWLRYARSDLDWLEHRSRLVDMKTGKVTDHLTKSCHKTHGPLTYTEGEMADALVQMGNALHDPTYYRQARNFLDFVTTRRRSNMVTPGGILQQPCESTRSRCVPVDKPSSALSGTPVETWLDQLSYKGILAQALDDYTAATGNHRYRAFLRRQATAIVENAIRDSKARPGNCRSPSTCWFVFYWGWPLNPSRPLLVNTATQMSALSILIGTLPQPPGGLVGPY